jgi:beta-lactam-binding protein with PASTA domain
MAGTSVNPRLPLLRGVEAFLIAGTLCLAVGGSLGGKRVAVPSVVGLDVYSAYNTARAAGFAVQTDQPFDVTPNVVSRVSQQSPAAWTSARPGTPLVLTPEQGLHGLLPPGGTQRMPRLVGKPLHDAVHTLETLGLLWSAAPVPALPASTRPSLLDNYRVAKQKPKPGTRFTQTVTRELANGDVLTETSTVGLVADLETR